MLAAVRLNGLKFSRALAVARSIARQDSIKRPQFMRDALRPSGVSRRRQNDLPTERALLRDELQDLFPKGQLADFRAYGFADCPLEGGATVDKRGERAEESPGGSLEQHQGRFVKQVGSDQGAVEINEQRRNYANGGACPPSGYDLVLW